MSKRFFTSEKYSNVYRTLIDSKGRRLKKPWYGSISCYLHGEQWHSKYYESERGAAIAVDMARIRIGKEPRNILKRK